MAGAGSRPRRARSAGEARAGAVSSPRRRSERNVASSAAHSVTRRKPSLGASKVLGATPRPAPCVMRPITLKKIVPCSRKIKEATVAPRRSPRVSVKGGKENVPARAPRFKSPGGGDAGTELEPFPLRCSSTPAAGAAILSPVDINTREPPPGDQRDLAMAKRVRRSYSRLEVSFSHSFLESRPSPGSGLADTSTPGRGLDKRQTLFGFEKLLLSDELAGVSPVGTSAPPVGTKAAEAAAEPDVLKEPDTDLPGIAFGKEKRRKKKTPQFAKSELDQWAALMNAEFEEAERFDLLVE